MAPSPHDWKIVDWDVKPQHKQTSIEMKTYSRHPWNWKWTCPIEKDRQIYLAYIYLSPSAVYALTSIFGRLEGLDLEQYEKKYIVYFALNFEEVDGAYWFQVVLMCIRPFFQKSCMLGFWNFIYGFLMEK